MLLALLNQEVEPLPTLPEKPEPPDYTPLPPRCGVGMGRALREIAIMIPLLNQNPPPRQGL
jgi:hypothetical protein